MARERIYTVDYEDPNCNKCEHGWYGYERIEIINESEEIYYDE